jgi:uncharacterized protein YhbP (UPF0306 family)
MDRLNRIASLIESQSTLTLTTQSDSPQAAPLFYRPGPGLTLYWFSSRRSAHSRNLRRNPAAAIAIYRPTDRWREILGVQMRGSVSIVEDPAERRSIADSYKRRFRLGRGFDAVLQRSSLYLFRPSSIRYTDALTLTQSAVGSSGPSTNRSLRISSSGKKGFRMNG